MQADIFLYNITSGQEQQLTTTESADLHPDIYADFIVWEDSSYANYDIILYDLASDETIRVTDDIHDQVNPCIWGDIIAWEDQRGDSPSIYYYDVKTGQEIQASEIGAQASKPDIWGNLIVWEQWFEDNSEIMLYNLSNQSIQRITFDSGNQQYPSIWENRIVWTQLVEGYVQISVYNLTTGNLTNLTSDPWNHQFPVIFGDLVVYESDQEYYDISVIDISTSEEILLSPNTPDSSQTQPALWGNRVAWRDARDWYYDIYLCTLGISKPPLTADFITNITEGLPPLVVEFTDTSTGDVSGWWWDFGDGAESHEQNPVHIFTEPEIYSVILTVHNPWQRTAVKMEGLITVGSPPTPDFSADVVSGPTPLAVYFTDNSIGYPTAWFWDFGDGTTSSEQYPFHTYETPGIYTVSLIAENKWGNGTTVKEDFITVVEGTSHQCILPEEGVELEYSDAGMHIVLDITAFEAIAFDPLENQSLVTGVPGSGSGISKVEFISGDEAGFYQAGNETIEGNLSGIVLISDDVRSPNRNSTAGLVWDYNYSAYYPEFSPGGRITSIVWEGSTPEDDLWFEEIAIDNDHHVNETAFTLLFQTENIWSSGPATIIFGIDSDWIEAYGWRWSHYIDTEPEGAMVYIDSKFYGYTPLEIGEGLTPGNHTVSLLKIGYHGYITFITLDDKRENIQAIRISDWGEESFLNTTFLYHDSDTNVDYFRVESPEGLSKFGIVSTWQEGNLFQLIPMAASKVVGPSGGGGGGGSDNGGGPVQTTTTSPPTPAVTPQPPPTSVSPIKPIPTEIDTNLPSAAPTGDISTVPESPPPTISGVKGVFPGIEPTMSLIIIRNLSVVFVVIFVTLVFYLRWKKKEE